MKDVQLKNIKIYGRIEQENRNNHDIRNLLINKLNIIDN